MLLKVLDFQSACYCIVKVSFASFLFLFSLFFLSVMLGIVLNIKSNSLDGILLSHSYNNLGFVQTLDVPQFTSSFNIFLECNMYGYPSILVVALDKDKQH